MRFRYALLALAATLAGAAPAAAATEQVQESASENWAGYVVSPNNGTNFSSVAASWVEPAATCSTASGATHAAFWVGLGGSSGQSEALEQTGTEVDCSATGQASHFAWYELVPSAPVRLDVAISAGDHVSARVTVDGSNVTVSLSDTTTGQSATRTLQMSSPDTSSAEWIAESPSACTASLQDCQPLTLSNFGRVTFTNASATAGGHTGSIADSAWTPSAVELTSQDGSGAQPSGSSNGSSFSVSYLQGNGGGYATYGGGYPGYGYGNGYGYGGGGYPGYGYAYGGGYPGY
jgi:peptidase A4-like protein